MKNIYRSIFLFTLLLVTVSSIPSFCMKRKRKNEDTEQTRKKRKLNSGKSKKISKCSMCHGKITENQESEELPTPTKLKFHKECIDKWLSERKKIIGMCTICLDDITDDQESEELTCPKKHKFHKACIDRWLSKNQKCPNCNVQVHENEVEREEPEIMIIQEVMPVPMMPPWYQLQKELPRPLTQEQAREEELDLEESAIFSAFLARGFRDAIEEAVLPRVLNELRIRNNNLEEDRESENPQQTTPQNPITILPPPEIEQRENQEPNTNLQPQPEGQIQQFEFEIGRLDEMEDQEDLEMPESESLLQRFTRYLIARGHIPPEGDLDDLLEEDQEENPEDTQEPEDQNTPEE